MDSFTQIILGAAVGEAAAGKKLGNRAMYYGALGGTLPDLDVIANLVTDEMTALAFHRSISHSFFFALTAPLLLGALCQWLYRRGHYKKRWLRSVVMGFWMLLIGLILFGLNFIIASAGSVNFWVLGGSLVFGGWVFYRIYQHYLVRAPEPADVSLSTWYGLFFWTIFTHPLLDCCTVFGTQVFQPFSDYRVAFNNIAVVDPLYTIPFLICLLIAARFIRNHPRRRLFNWLGIGLSSAYLVYTFVNKRHIDQTFVRSLEKAEIPYQRYMTAPTIFNNLLWTCMAEGDTSFYIGFYSLYDSLDYIPDIRSLPKNHELLLPYADERTIKILRWFSKDYFNVIRNDDGQLQFNDLRYGTFGEGPPKPDDYIFRFILEEKNGELTAYQTRDNNLNKENLEEFWRRIWGEKSVNK